LQSIGIFIVGGTHMKRTTGMDRAATQHWRPATQAVRAGTWRSDALEMSEALYLTQGYTYDCAEDAEARFKGELEGYTYSRLQNPTVAMLEERLCLLEGAEAARATASGMAAMTAALLALVQAGDHVVAARAMFGSCRWLVDTLLPRFGVATTVVDGPDTQAWARARQPNTKAFFLETPGNPTLDIIDLQSVADLAHDSGAKLIVDNVFATPIFQKPMRFGADIVAYSLTKHVDGQGRVLGGVVLSDAALMHDQVLPFLRNTGPTLSAFNAWVLLKGLETLDLRVRAQAQAALLLAQHLEAKGLRARYPYLPSHPQAALARAQMQGGGTVITFELADKAQAFAFLNALKIIDISNNLGDSRSMITHPATTTHSALSDETRQQMGITSGMLRFSVGLEDVADLQEDIDQALAHI
jgi:O-succinylhomoserine sulfhydrylase